MNTEKFPVEKVVNALKRAFGGASQLPDYVVGLAIAGQINNNWWSFTASDLDAVVRVIYQDQDEIDQLAWGEILRGMSIATAGWPDDNLAVMALRALEQSAH